MQNNDTISINQMIFILMLTMVGTGILTLPRNLAEVVPYDQWIILLAGGLLALSIALIHGSIVKLSPNKQYFQILCDALTKPVAYVIGFAYIIYLTVFIALITRTFGEVIKAFLLAKTPIEVINVSILAVSVYLARRGIEVLARMMEFIFPIIILFSIFIFGLSFLDSDVLNLLPVFKIEFNDIIKGLPVTLTSFVGFEMILFFGGYLDKPQNAMKSYRAIIAVLCFYVLVVVATFAQFGPIQMKYLVWPTIDLFYTIRLPGLFIENVQVIVMGLWIFAIFSTIAPMHLAAVTMAESLTKSKDQAYLAAPFLPIIYFISIVPENISENYEMISKYTNYSSSIMIFAIPLIILVSLVIQKKLRREAQSNA